MRKVEVSVLFNEGSVIIGKESYTNLKEKNPEKTAWKKLKNILTEGPKKNKQQSLEEKVLQSETSTSIVKKALAGRKATLTSRKYHQYLPCKRKW